VINVISISKSFGETEVLKNISVDFQPGHVNLIIGQSGSGKTVLLKTIVGLFSPDSGSVKYDGRDFTKMNTHQKGEIRKEIGMLFQGGALFDWANVEQNVQFPLDFFTKMTYKEKHERVMFCLERVKLGRESKLMPGELSGGMKKRVAIARAIALNPKYLFCDEPNSGLDPKTSKIIDTLIYDITKEYNMTTIVNTHDMNTVFAIGEKIAFIKKGTLWWSGDKESLINTDNPELREYLLASDVVKNANILQNEHNS